MLRNVRSVVLASACFCLAPLFLGACGSAALPTSAGAGSLAAPTPGSASPGWASSAAPSPGPASSGPARSGSATPGPARSASAKPASQGFIGYDWLVVSIRHDGKTTSIPARLNVNMRFSTSGRFGADDSVNTYGGSFATMPGGFRTSVAGTLVGYAGHDPAVLLSQSMMIAFGNGAPAAARVTGNQLVISVASYTLTCQRHGPAGSLS